MRSFVVFVAALCVVGGCNKEKEAEHNLGPNNYYAAPQETPREEATPTVKVADEATKAVADEPAFYYQDPSIPYWEREVVREIVHAPVYKIDDSRWVVQEFEYPTSHIGAMGEMKFQGLQTTGWGELVSYAKTHQNQKDDPRAIVGTGCRENSFENEIVCPSIWYDNKYKNGWVCTNLRLGMLADGRQYWIAGTRFLGILEGPPPDKNPPK